MATALHCGCWMALSARRYATGGTFRVRNTARFSQLSALLGSRHLLSPVWIRSPDHTKQNLYFHSISVVCPLSISCKYSNVHLSKITQLQHRCIRPYKSFSPKPRTLFSSLKTVHGAQRVHPKKRPCVRLVSLFGARTRVPGGSVPFHAGRLRCCHRFKSRSNFGSDQCSSSGWLVQRSHS